MLERVKRFVRGDETSWRTILLLAIPAPILAFFIGLFFELRSGDPTPFDLVCYPLAGTTLLVLELLLLKRRVDYIAVASTVIGMSSVFFLGKLFYLLTFYGGPDVQAQLTETFFWIPSCFLLAVFIPKARFAHLVSTLFFCALGGLTAFYVVFPTSAAQPKLTHALIQLALANLTFFIVTRALIGMRVSLSRSQTELAVMERLAHTDQLTQTPNRLKFEAEVDKRVALGERFAVCFLDLDNFKNINDSLGHAFGDELLVAATRRMQGRLREGDLLARVSGDEFVLLLRTEGAHGEAADVLERVVSALADPFRLEDKRVDVTASAGLSRYPDDAATTETLLRYADIAMYEAKEAGKGQIRTFSTASEVALERRQRLATDLKTAAARGEFEVVYQPIIDLSSGRVTRLEALLRWTHPELGPVSPGEFIPVAESNGTICSISTWVLREACRELKRWQGRGWSDLKMAVNVSPVWFASASFETEVGGILRTCRVAGPSLELELTEGVLIDNVERGKVLLARLRGRGINIAIDDFGTGFSSLAYLKHFEIDTLKIDRSFISDLKNTRDLPHTSLALFEAFSALSRTLDIALVAEGIETEAQLEIARSFGTQLGQGYYFSKPLSAADLQTVLGPPQEVAALALVN